MITAEEEKAIVEKYRADFPEGTSDEEILSKARFIEDGKGLIVIRNEAERRAVMKKLKEERLKEE